MDVLPALLTQMLGLLPFLIIPVIGLVLCRKRLARSHPKASSRATVGWVLLIVQLSIGRGAGLYVTVLAAQSGNRIAYVSWLSLIGLANQLLLFASLLFLMLAILADRGGSDS